MGKNKNTFRAAVGEMKHFLLGSALVLTLVTVVPVLAQSDPGMGAGMGGGQQGGMNQQMGQQMGNQLKQQMNQNGGMNSNQAGQVGKLMNQMNQLNNKQGQQGMGQQNLKQTGTSGLNGSANKMMNGQQGMGMGQNQKGQMNNKMNQKKAPKKMDASKFTKSYDKVLATITKANDQFAAKVAKIKTPLKTPNKVFTLVNATLKNDVKFCRVTQTPMIPLELDVEDFDCQGYIEEQMAALSDLKESYLAAESDDERTEILTSVTDLGTESLDQFSTVIEDLKTAIEDAVEAANAEQEEENIIEEEEPTLDYSAPVNTVPDAVEPAPATGTTNTGL